MTAAASSTLTASEIGEPGVDTQPEVEHEPPVYTGRGPRITVDTVELMKAEVNA